MTNSATAPLISAIQGRAGRTIPLIERDASLLKGENFPAPIAGISPDTGRIRRFFGQGRPQDDKFPANREFAAFGRRWDQQKFDTGLTLISRSAKIGL